MEAVIYAAADALLPCSYSCPACTSTIGCGWHHCTRRGRGIDGMVAFVSAAAHQLLTCRPRCLCWHHSMAAAHQLLTCRPRRLCWYHSPHTQEAGYRRHEATTAAAAHELLGTQLVVPWLKTSELGSDSEPL